MKRTPLKRTTGLQRTTPIKRTAFKRKRRAAAFFTPGKVAFQEAARAQLACMNPRCPDPSAPWNAHHVIYAQHVRREDPALEWDPANAMRLCADCHARHHSGAERLPVDVLPPAALEFARLLFGGQRAAAYLDRYYDA